jgi:hypothetical protein
MRTQHVVLVAGLLLVILAVNPGCDSVAPPSSDIAQADVSSAATATAAVKRDLAAARAATARFQRVDVAEDAQYAQGTPCIESPAGGMGYHWINDDLMGQLEVTAPQALLYEPMRNGRLNLVAVEYIVPFDVLGPDEDPPVLFGEEFHHGPIPAWILHVWLWKNNPSGIFADWNPNVSCQYAS